MNLVLFGGCALAVAHYSGLGSTVELVVAVVAAVLMMRLLSTRRAQPGLPTKRSSLSVTETSH